MIKKIMGVILILLIFVLTGYAIQHISKDKDNSYRKVTVADATISSLTQYDKKKVKKYLI